MRPLFAILVGAAAALASGCSGDSDEPASSTSSTSENGHYKGTFVPDPKQPIVGSNRLEATLTTADAAPLVSATVAAQPWMPAHGHGSAAVPEVSEHAEGHYEIDNIVYEMPGQWELRIDVSVGGVDDRFLLNYDVR